MSAVSMCLQPGYLYKCRKDSLVAMNVAEIRRTMRCLWKGHVRKCAALRSARSRTLANMTFPEALDGHLTERAKKLFSPFGILERWSSFLVLLILSRQ